jgi:hypothetical protein
MPVGLRSRYAGLAVEQAPDASGELRALIPIRRHEGVDTTAGRYRHVVTGAETVEYLAWRYQGSSDEWWRVADANPLRFPLDWRTGETVLVAGQATPGLVLRDRRF